MAAVAEGMDNQQIADMLDISVSNVTTHLCRAAEKIEDYIGDRNPRVMILRYYRTHMTDSLIELWEKEIKE